jgi:hypothetical protein
MGIRDAMGPLGTFTFTRTAWGAGIRGRHLGTTAVGGTGEVDFGTDSAIPIPTANDCTVVLSYRKLTETDNNAAVFGLAGGGTDRFDLFLKGYGANYWDYGGTTNGYDRLIVASAGITYTADNIWAVTVGPRGMEMFLNGLLIGSNGGTPTRTASTTAFTLFGGVGVSCDTAECDFFRLYKTQLATSLLFWQAKEPYAMFRPIVRRRYFIPVAETIHVPRATMILDSRHRAASY